MSASSVDAAASGTSPSTTRTACLLYISLCIYRILNALLIQTQFDPDEYWQTLEPAYCEAFPERHQCAFTWEWLRRSPDDAKWWMHPFEGPIRSYLSVIPTYLLYVAIRKWQLDEMWTWVVPRGPVLLNAVLVAAPTDLATWYIGQWVGSPRSPVCVDTKRRYTLAYCCLLCSVISWFNSYALIRTYSNSTETMLLTVALALVSPELFGNTLRPKRKLRTACAFVLGGMSVAIRFTSLAAFIPVGILLADQKPTNLQRIKFLLVPCALYGLVGITLSLTVDRLLYGFWTAPFLGSLHFNVIQGLGSLYGTHPVHWYFSAGIPAISGTMLPFVLYDNFTLWNGQPSLSGRNIWIIIFCYTMLHSLSAHKEFRFLLPILPLFCVRAGHVIYNKIMMTRRSQAAMILLFIVPNLMAVVYLGTFHQGAPILINQRIRQLLSTGNSTAINKRISIHYLMGCHSTPLYSHLHIPSILVDVWTLDCSPDCRASPDKDCESDIFYRDPVRFVDTVYSLSKSEPETCTDRDDFCPSETKPLPDLLAVYSREAFILKAQLKRMGLVEVDRFAHSINGLKLGSFQFGDDFASESFRHLNLFGHLLEISLEDMVLYASKHVFDTKGTS